MESVAVKKVKVKGNKVTSRAKLEIFQEMIKCLRESEGQVIAFFTDNSAIVSFKQLAFYNKSKYNYSIYFNNNWYGISTVNGSTELEYAEKNEAIKSNTIEILKSEVKETKSTFEIFRLSNHFAQEGEEVKIDDIKIICRESPIGNTYKLTSSLEEYETIGGIQFPASYEIEAIELDGKLFFTEYGNSVHSAFRRKTLKSFISI